MSIFDRLRRILPFKPVSVPIVTEDRRKEISEMIRKQIIASGMIPPGAEVNVIQWSARNDYTSWTPDQTVGSMPISAIKPPEDAGADGWTWEAWSAEMNSMAFPGWSPCRFAHRTSPRGQPDAARFVFGITRGPFGLWQQNFDVCGYDTEAEAWNQETGILTCLTHLPTGMGLGLFNGKDAAALAADTAMRTCPNWPETEWSTTPGSPWMVIIDRTVSAWAMLGISSAENAHAHDPSTGTGPYAIMDLAENLEHGKPEKLS